jgi:flagellar biosynthesis GTPase FlhF
MVVSIPVTHPDAPPRNGMVLGQYESIEMIREIPLKGNDDPETNPVEWIMVTRSDPGGGIPRFMVERNVPSSIVADAVKFLDWACARTEDGSGEEPKGDEENAKDVPHQNNGDSDRYLLENSNGLGAGVGTSIAERPSSTRRRASQQTVEPVQEGYLDQLRDAVTGLGAYVPDAMNPMPQLQRTISSSSSSSTLSADSFASAEQFSSAPQGLPIDNSIPTPSNASEVSIPVEDDSHHARELNKIEAKKAQMREKLDADLAKHRAAVTDESQKSQKELEKAAERHAKEKQKQEERFAKEIRKLEERREKETRKLLAKQQKEADKNKLATAQRERDECKKEKELVDQENKLLREQIAELQKENTALVVKLGKSDIGKDILASVRSEGRSRANSRASASSGKSGLLRTGTAPVV